MRSPVRLLLPLAVATSVLAAPAVAHADTVWLCRPGADPNPCRSSLKTTLRSFDSKPKVVTPKRVSNPAIDCFYVYPTVSAQATPAANLAIEPAEISIANYQAARFSQVCNVYAPMYRQITLSGLGRATTEDRENAYSDVKNAWLEYRAANPDRPFVLIGHSQGSGVLKRLLKEEIEPNDALRAQMLSAMLTGSSVAVPKGQAIGGDFTKIPLCTRAGQFNCIISYGSFGQKPPADTFFGRVRDVSALPAGVQYEAACTNPASLAKNKKTTLDGYLRGEPIAGLLGVAANLMYSGKPPTAKTAWLKPKDRYKASCVRSGGAHVLMVTPIGKSKVLKPSPTAQWGLHLLDVNLPLGDLVDVVRAQQKAYLAGR